MKGGNALLRDSLVLADDPRPWIPGDEYASAACQKQHLDRFIDRHCDEQVIGDNRAFASLWARHYFLRLAPPVIAAGIFLGRRLPVLPSEIGVIVDEDGIACAIRLPHEGCIDHESFAGDPFLGLDELLRLNLAPFIKTLAELVTIAPRALWSSVGDYLEMMLTGLGSERDVDPERLAVARLLIELEVTPDGRRNPLYEPIRYLPAPGETPCDASQRVRRVCCVQYMAPTLGYCDDCPHLYTRNAKIAAKAAREAASAGNAPAVPSVARAS